MKKLVTRIINKDSNRILNNLEFKFDEKSEYQLNLVIDYLISQTKTINSCDLLKVEFELKEVEL